MGFYKQFFQMLYYILRCFKMVFKKKNLFFVGLIIFIVLVFCFYNNVFAADDISVLESGYVDTATNKIVSYSGYKFLYFDTTPNYLYTLTNNYLGDRPLWLVVSDSVGFGSEVSRVTLIPVGESYSFVGTGSSFGLVVSNSSYNDGDIVLSSQYLNGFDDTTTSLVDSVSLENLWSVVPPTLIALGVLFAIGYIVVKKVLKRDSNAY